MRKPLLFIAVFLLLIGSAAAATRTLIRADGTIVTQSITATTPPAATEQWIALTTTPSHKKVFKDFGCTITQELNDATAIACPKGLAVRFGVPLVEDKAVKIADTVSNAQINADDVHSLAINGAGVKVAVLDTGVQGNHAELSDSILQRVYFITNSPDDVDGHGTHVAGTITANGANQINSIFATGAAPGAGILSGKVLNDVGSGTYSSVAAGIEWAVAQGADVISMSLSAGNYGSHCDTEYLAQKANWAVDQGVTVVAAAGNDNRGVGSPACGSKVIAVGAVNKDDQRARWSNKGSALDIMAPGVDILSSYSCIAAGDCGSTWYAYLSGTSMATPHVAGVAALLLQSDPSLTPAEVSSTMKSTAKNLGLSPDQQGAGRVDALAAINALGAPSPVCGNGILEGTEQCDDGNTINGDGCSSSCAIEYACTPQPKGKCNCDGVCSRKESLGGICADCS